MKKFIYFLPLLTILFHTHKTNTKETHLFRIDNSKKIGKIIIISGLTSCGKSSSSQALQKIFTEKNIPFIILGMDDFLKAFPDDWINITSSSDVSQKKEGGVTFEKVIKTKQELKEEKKKAKRYYKKPLEHKYVPNIGTIVQELMQGMTLAVKAFAHQGVNVIFEGGLPLYGMKTGLWEHRPYLFLVSCDIEVAEEREDKRDGFRGLARGMRDLNFKKDVDLIVDTSNTPPDKVAKKMYDYMLKYEATEPTFLLEDAKHQINVRRTEEKEIRDDRLEVEQEIRDEQQKARIKKQTEERKLHNLKQEQQMRKQQREQQQRNLTQMKQLEEQVSKQIEQMEKQAQEQEQRDAEQLERIEKQKKQRRHKRGRGSN